MPQIQSKSYFKKFITRHKTDLILLNIILLITLFANINLFKVPFIYDDYDFLFKWETIKNIKNIPDLLLGDLPPTHEGVYRPLRSIFYLISYHLYDHNILLYHIQELFIYSLITILIYLITQKMFKNRPLSFFTTLFYATLPIHIDNLANLTANFDTIGVVFFFLSFYLFQNYLESGNKNKKHLLILSSITALAAFSTYEITLILPFLILLYTFFQHKKPTLLTLTHLLTPAIVYLFIRINLLHITTRGSMFYDLSGKLTNIGQNILHYLTISIIPAKTEIPTLSSIYGSLAFSKHLTAPLPNNYELTTIYIAPIFLLIVLSISIVKFIKRKTSGFGLIWFFVSLIPAILISIQSSGLNEPYPAHCRYAIIATYGICLLAGNWLTNLLKLHPKSIKLQYFKILNISLLITILLINIIVNFNNLNKWRDARTFLIDEINQIPDNNPDKHNDLGVLYASEKKLKPAILEFEKALKINPNHSIAKENLQKVCLIAKKTNLPDNRTRKTCNLKTN